MQIFYLLNVTVKLHDHMSISLNVLQKTLEITHTNVNLIKGSYQQKLKWEKVFYLV